MRISLPLTIEGMSLPRWLGYINKSINLLKAKRPSGHFILVKYMTYNGARPIINTY